MFEFLDTHRILQRPEGTGIAGAQVFSMEEAVKYLLVPLLTN